LPASARVGLTCGSHHPADHIRPQGFHCSSGQTPRAVYSCIFKLTCVSDNAEAEGYGIRGRHAPFRREETSPDPREIIMKKIAILLACATALALPFTATAQDAEGTTKKDAYRFVVVPKVVHP